MPQEPENVTKPNESAGGSFVQTATFYSRASLPKIVIALNTASFALCFAVWVMFGPSMRSIARELHISLPMASLIKTLPILIGSVMRVPIGMLTDKFGARKVFSLLMLATAGSVYGLSLAHSAADMILGALAMGMVGTSFVVGVQAVSSWTAKEIQGVALGIFGAGNVGTAVTTFGLPLLMGVAGWRGAFRWYALGMLASGAIYWLVARNAPRTATIVRKSPLAPLQNAQTWRFGLYYMATFGVFVATTLTITDIYIDAFRMPLKTAGLLATTFTFTASLARIPGGKLADKFGARNVVCISQFVAAYVLIFVCFGPPLPATVLLVFAAALALGIGMGGVFRYIPDFFPATVGAVGGVVGALGGLGGFFLPQLSSALKLAFRNPFLQVLPLAVLPLIAVTVQHVAIKKRTAARAALDALSQPGH